MPDPIAALLENTQEVARLLELHEETTGTKPGRRFGVEILNKSAVVLLTACWEAFVEDAASDAFEFILQETTDPSKLPNGVKQRVARLLKEDKHELKVWELAEKGWQNVLHAYQQQMVSAHLGFFHTPKAGNVDQLFEALLDLPNISANWSWKGMSKQRGKQRLTEYIDLRGSIAHRVKAIQAVHKVDVTDYSSFIQHLSVRTANVVRDHLHSLVGKHPWPGYKIGSFH